MIDHAPERYEVSNSARDSSPVVRVTAVDTTQDPLHVLKIVVESLALNAEFGLWLAPYSGISMVPRLSPFDLVYLDKQKQVAGVAAVRPGKEPTPPKGEIGSALVLPLHTISTLRLDEGVSLGFSLIAEEADELGEALEEDVFHPARGKRAVEDVSAASNGDLKGSSQPALSEPATQPVRKRSRRRTLTEDERRVVETLKGYLVEPLEALRSADRYSPPTIFEVAPEELAASARAEADLPAPEEVAAPEIAEEVASTAAEADSLAPEELAEPEIAEAIASEPEEADSPAPEEFAAPEIAEAIATTPEEADSLAPEEFAAPEIAEAVVTSEPAEVDPPTAAAEVASSPVPAVESPVTEHRRPSGRIRVRRPRAQLSPRPAPEPAQQEAAEEAGQGNVTPAEATAAFMGTASLPEEAVKPQSERPRAQEEVAAGAVEAAEPIKAASSPQQAFAFDQPAPAEVLPRRQEPEPDFKRTAAAEPLRESEGTEVAARTEEAAPVSSVDAEQKEEKKVAAATPAPPATRKEPPAAAPANRDKPMRKLPPIPVAPHQRLLIHPFHTPKKAEPPPIPKSILDRLKDRAVASARGFANRRGAIRREVPGLIAYPWGIRDSHAYQIANLSSSGFFVQTHERWPRGAVVSLVLQRIGDRETRSEHRVLVEAGTIRWDPDGLGLVCVLPAADDLRIWEGLPNSPWFQKGPEAVVREFRTARALGFLRQVCPAGYHEFRLMMHDEFTFHRVSNAVDIVFMAEDVVSREPGTFKYQAHPKLVREILNLGSWADADPVKDLWAGLLATACSAEGQEVLNLTFAEMISRFTVVHAQLLTAVCARAAEAYQGGRDLKPTETYCTAKEFMASTRTRNLLKIHYAILQLCELGLMQMKSDKSWAGEMAEMRASPTILGLQLYMRCSRLDSQRYVLRSQ